MARAPSPSFSGSIADGGSHNDTGDVSSPARFSMRLLHVSIISILVALFLLDLGIFDEIILGYKFPPGFNSKHDDTSEDGERDVAENGVVMDIGRRNPVVPYKWGTVIDCCPIRLGTMFQEGESTLYDYFTGKHEEIIHYASDDNFFCEFTMKAFNRSNDIIADMNVDRIIRSIHLGEGDNASVVTSQVEVAQPIDFVYHSPSPSSPSSSQMKGVRIVDISSILHARSHKCTQNILEYLNEQTMPIILLHGSVYTHDNCGDGGIVSMSRIVEMLESPNILMYISSVSVLIHGVVREIDQRLASSPKTLILPSGLHSSINSHSIHRYLRNVYVNRIRKINMLQVSSAKIALPLQEYLASTFKSSFGPSDNPDNDYFRSLSQSKFVLCTDIWKIDESLLFGAIPIVETSTGLNRVYSNLPVMFLDSFRSISPELLEDAYECFKIYANRYDYSHLNMNYWRETIIHLIRENNLTSLSSSSFDNPYCNYRDGKSHRWNETVVGYAFLRGDRQSALEIREKLNVHGLPKDKQYIYRPFRHSRTLRIKD